MGHGPSLDDYRPLILCIQDHDYDITIVSDAGRVPCCRFSLLAIYHARDKYETTSVFFWS